MPTKRFDWSGTPAQRAVVIAYNSLDGDGTMLSTFAAQRNAIALLESEAFLLNKIRRVVLAAGWIDRERRALAFSEIEGLVNADARYQKALAQARAERDV